MNMVTTTRAQKRLEGGWFQRLAWAALGWFSLGLLVWVPFLYVALRAAAPPTGVPARRSCCTSA